MENKIKQRVIKEAKTMIKTDNTIRQIAKKYKVSKSTVHKDMQERLKKIDINLYKEIIQIIENHVATRHIKGGESTKKKYLKIHYNI